jgi:hypothetical protein
LANAKAGGNSPAVGYANILRRLATPLLDVRVETP